ncbi:MAG: hypothetical protein K2X99_01450, partial [Gemmatimonadaceae bacterium]|nr:hypothetical protein [Gemmatimonadaceae bacterium]
AKGYRTNGELPGAWVLAHGGVSAAARARLESAAERLQLSARAFHRVARVARTIADLDGDAEVGPAAIGEALRFRGTLQGSAAPA